MSGRYGTLTAPKVNTTMTARAVLCLPIGSHEQHGPHLPLHTDTIIGERFAERIVERFGGQHDIWLLPSMPYGLSLEHAWSPGTLSLRISVLISFLDMIVAECVRATPSRRFLIVNGHGGNRGILEAALYELERQHGIRACAIHPLSLSTNRAESGPPEIHAGVLETSVMLAIAPDEVQLGLLDGRWPDDENRGNEVARQVLGRGVTWPWNSGDELIAAQGVMGGDPRTATADLGSSILADALDSCAGVLERL